ncbi:hypothetical protein CPB84DRAFT_312726 [Gymnopilus junonius]|uniref:Uncharacterized protein n=1 Tax=Gymnopilus junonius TaxID=109634 RepID=A0A9P5NE04_GYMJU|nr:hypothetical protein CPB84DRAFT_312726 [Gymnopilus junonius]
MTQSPEPESKTAIQEAMFSKVSIQDSKTYTQSGNYPLGQSEEHACVNFIQRFLASCDPPMTQYLEAFKAFGVTEIHLRPLSKWEVNRRKDLLKKILEKVSQPVSDLDLTFLDNHACTYFN